MPVGGVLALDLSSTVGFAYGDMTDKRPWFGSWKLPKPACEGFKYASFENELAATMDRLRPSHIVIEAVLPLPVLASGKSNHYAVAQQFSLRGIVHSEAWRAECPIPTEIDAYTARSEVTGQTRNLRSAEWKALVIEFCRKRSWVVPDDHAADAIILWLWHKMRMTHQPPVYGPLWRDIS
jgi:hypothetical protein